MQPAPSFPEANATFGPPPGMAEIHIASIRAYMGHVKGGVHDGEKLVVTAWKPNEAEIQAIKDGRPIFIAFLGGLPPHYVATNFQQAASIA